MKEKTSQVSSAYLDDLIYDIESYLNDFPNRNFAIKYLADQSKLSSKTIKRILEKTSRPSYQSLFKIYRVIHNTTDENEIIKKVSCRVAKVLKKSNPVNLKKYSDDQINLFQIFKENPLAGEIFLLAGSQNLSLNTIAYRYGQLGVETLEELIKHKVIIEIDSKQYTLNSNLPRLDGKVLKELGLRMIKRFSDPSLCDEEGENIIALYAEALNQEGIAQWLRIDTEAFHKKIKIAKQSKYQGHIPYFTFQASDQLNSRKNS